MKMVTRVLLYPTLALDAFIGILIIYNFMEFSQCRDINELVFVVYHVLRVVVLLALFSSFTF